MKTRILSVALIALVAWWFLAVPPGYHAVPPRIVYGPEATQAAQAVDQSDAFAQGLETIPVDIPGYDDIVFLEGGKRWLLSAMDGQIWSYEPGTGKAEPFIKPPKMAAGMHESPTDKDVVYFCASRLWGDKYADDERVGLYRLRVASKKIEPVVLDVPNKGIERAQAWALDDPKAPKLSKTSAPFGKRALEFCNDLEISEDGQRVYFSEPFSHPGASMGGGTIPEALALQGNGRIWVHDLSLNETRLVSEGLHFPDGLLLDQHPGQAREMSLLTSLTTGFGVARVYVDGPKAGQTEMVHSGLPGMCDGMDRDGAGNIWCAMYAHRSGFLTWLHANPWAKHVLLRLPLNWIPQPKRTGLIVLSPDASKMIYSAWYQGDQLTHNASTLVGPDGYAYPTPFSRTHRGIVRIKNPLLQP